MLLSIALVAGAFADDQLDLLMQQGDLSESVRSRSEGALVKESIAVEQARAKAQSRSEYGLELRPRISDNEVGAALRVYLPSSWNKSKLREQLALVAQEEQLRVHALEWQELMEVYRGFCEFRMLNKQLKIYQEELSTLEPYLEKANLQVELNQLSVVDRAKLYSLYLDVLNSEEKVKADLLESRMELQLLVGAGANLDAMAGTALITMPPQANFDQLFDLALKNRSDFLVHAASARSTYAAEAVARSEDGFRLKYIQPDVEVDYNNGDTTFGLTASFVLPWGTRNPDIAVYQQQRALSLSVMDLQRRLIANRLRVLLKTADAYYAQAEERGDRIKPLLTKLDTDLKTMDTGRFEDLRDVLLVRERMLDVELQTTRSVCVKEQLAVDIAEEVGSLTQ
jgi:outer membrane protein TolC